MLRAIDLIRLAIQTSDAMVMPLIDDMSKQSLVQPTDEGGNHALWVLGHLAVAEANLYRMLTGEPHPLEHWRTMFDAGSVPAPDETRYPSFDEVRAAFYQMRKKNLSILESTDDEKLGSRPVGPLPDVGSEYFASIGHAYVTMAIHQAFHGGQVADARRAAGRPPLVE
jgi:hypothetical protein